MDSISAEKRSWNMSRIRGRDTKPELAVRSLLHRMGYRFRLSNAVLPGKPDIILPRFRSVIFVHGCFWHRHKRCRFAYTPKSRTEFWQKKFAANMRRDKAVAHQISALDWRQLVIWECEIKDTESVKRRLEEFLRGQ